MKFKNFAVFCLFSLSVSVFSQQNTVQNNYLVFDASKSLPGNEIIDRIQFLMSNSEAVELPVDVVNKLNNLNDSSEVAQKLNFYRASILRVFYNPKISPKDKVFMAERYLSSQDSSIEPILPDIEKFLMKYKN